MIPAPSIPTADELEQLGAGVPELILFGTSSWNYPGWQGLVYHQSYPKSGAAARMLAEYVKFPLFRTIGIDSSFYAPLTEDVLGSYAKYLEPGFPCISKVWDRITVHTFSRSREKSKGGELNPDFLNAELFIEEVLAPQMRCFRDHAGPMVFEFQTIARSSGVTPEDFVGRLDDFLSLLPRDTQYAVEVRNEEFLTPAYFAVLREHAVCHVFSSWTRMPPIGAQLDLAGSVSAPFIVVRVLLRPGRTYDEAVDAFAPYDRIQDPNPELRYDVLRMIEEALRQRIPAYVLVNNRAEGSAPLSIAEFARLAARLKPPSPIVGR